ncbi:MAG: hypothetical protein IH595_02695 [Bacteroidales bacterium]|nr:hypothetical protein [Bacteroidales bacterium]
MNKTSISILVSVVLILLLGGYYFYARQGNTHGNPWKMLPNTPAFVLQTDEPGDLYKKLSQDNERYKSLKGIKQIENLDHSVQQFLDLIETNRELSNKVLDSPFYLSVYSDSTSGPNPYLMLFQIRESVKISDIKQLITESNSGKDVTMSVVGEGSQKILNVVNAKANLQFHVAVLNGVVALSPSEPLLQKALITYPQTNFTENNAFKKVAGTSGKIVDARLYINYPEMAKLLSNYANTDYKNDVQQLSHFAQWTETDLILKSKNLLLSGFTFSGPDDLLSQFDRKNEESPNLYSLFPFNSDVWLNKSFQKFSKSAAADQLNKFSAPYRDDLKNLIQVSREVCFVSNALSPNEMTDKSWCIVSFDDELKGATLLKDLALKSNGSFVRNYGSHAIRKINLKDFLPVVYGKIFDGVDREYYTILNGSAVFGHNPEDLIQLIHYYDTGKTLDLNDNFKAFSTNMLRTSNLTFQLQLRSFTDLFPKYLEKNLSSKLLASQDILKDFQYITMQFNREGSMFYTNFALEYNSAYKEENLALWKIQLDDSIVGKPYLVKDPKNGKYDIIVFDRGDHMYFIDYNGKILWTKRLPNLPISKIYQVDYYKNGKIQYLFNTANNLFLIDRDGHFVADYPIPLHPAATNGITVFDYTDRKDYRIMVAQADEKIHDYTIKGNPVRGWTYPQMPDITVQPIYRLLTSRKDFIIITDIQNNVKIVDRRGRQRIYLKDNFKKAKNSAFYLNSTNNKGIIITTDEQGQLVYISRNGNVTFTDFGKFSPEHYFLYDDFNGDHVKDFIFIDHKKLVVFNRFKKELFNYTFSSDIDVQPEFFSLGGKQKVLGVVASHENTIYLFDNQGNILIGRGLTGATPFTVGSLNRSGDINLITAAGNTLYNYRLK